MKFTPPAKSVNLSSWKMAAMRKNISWIVSIVMPEIAKWSVSRMFTAIFSLSLFVCAFAVSQIFSQLLWLYCFSHTTFMLRPCRLCLFSRLHDFDCGVLRGMNACLQAYEGVSVVFESTIECENIPNTIFTCIALACGNFSFFAFPSFLFFIFSPSKLGDWKNFHETFTVNFHISFWFDDARSQWLWLTTTTLRCFLSRFQAFPSFFNWKFLFAQSSVTLTTCWPANAFLQTGKYF